MMAHLLLLGALGGRQMMGPEEMFNACAKGNIGAVNTMIQKRKDLVIVSLKKSNFEENVCQFLYNAD